MQYATDLEGCQGEVWPAIGAYDGPEQRGLARQAAAQLLHVQSAGKEPIVKTGHSSSHIGQF